VGSTTYRCRKSGESSRDAPAMKRARVAALTLIGLVLLLLALVLLPE